MIDRSQLPKRPLRDRNCAWLSWNVLVNTVAASPAASPALRRSIYNRCGIAAETREIVWGCWFFGPDVRIGPYTLVNHRCYFDSRSAISIGAHCDIGMEVMFCTSTHTLGDAHRRAGELELAPIEVGDGCWIGARATVLPGVVIPSGVVVASGSVVTTSCEPNGLYAGVPARRIRDL